MILQKHVLSFKCNDFFKMANLKAISSSATLMQERINSIVNTLELSLSCTKPSKCYLMPLKFDDVMAPDPWPQNVYWELGIYSIYICYLSSRADLIVEMGWVDNYLHNGISYTGKMMSLYWNESQYWYGQNRLFVHLTAPLFVSVKLYAKQLDEHSIGHNSPCTCFIFGAVICPPISLNHLDYQSVGIQLHKLYMQYPKHNSISQVESNHFHFSILPIAIVVHNALIFFLICGRKRMFHPKSS